MSKCSRVLVEWRARNPQMWLIVWSRNESCQVPRNVWFHCPVDVTLRRSQCPTLGEGHILRWLVDSIVLSILDHLVNNKEQCVTFWLCVYVEGVHMVASKAMYSYAHVFTRNKEILITCTSVYMYVQSSFDSFMVSSKWKDLTFE